jgi:hypothetical protein
MVIHRPPGQGFDPGPYQKGISVQFALFHQILTGLDVDTSGHIEDKFTFIADSTHTFCVECKLSVCFGNNKFTPSNKNKMIRQQNLLTTA